MHLRTNCCCSASQMSIMYVSQPIKLSSVPSPSHHHLNNNRVVTCSSYGINAILISLHALMNLVMLARLIMANTSSGIAK